jgi:hypothetical protein
MKNCGAASQAAAPALMPAHGGRVSMRVETSLDPAGKSACATEARP